MKTRENNVISDETKFEQRDKNYYHAEVEDSNVNDESTADPEKPKKSSSPKMKAVGVGVMAGVAGALGYSALRAAPAMDEELVAGELGESESRDSNIISNPNIEEPSDLGEIELATTPDDEMSFNEAFAAARKEVGPNGVFEWRGGVFNTYYREEWDNLSDKYKDEFGNHDWRGDFDNLEKNGDAASNEPHIHNPEDYEQDITGFEILKDEDGNEYIALKDAITGEEMHVSPEELGMAVTDEHGDVIAFLSNDYLEKHPEPNGVIQFDSEGNCILVDVMDYGDIDDPDDVGVPEPYDEDVEVLNPEDEDVVVPDEFEGDYAVVDDNGEVVGGETSMEDFEVTEDVACSEDICVDDLPEIDDEGMIMEDSAI